MSYSEIDGTDQSQKYLLAKFCLLTLHTVAKSGSFLLRNFEFEFSPMNF